MNAAPALILALTGLVVGLPLPQQAAAQTPGGGAPQTSDAAAQPPVDVATQIPGGTAAPAAGSPSGLAASPPAGTPDQANSATYPTPSEPGTGATPAQAADPHAAADQHRRNALRTAAASGNTGSINTGMTVETKSGQSEGSVVDVVRQVNGRPAYIVIADHGGNRRAVTYQAARLMVHGNRLVVDELRLQGAPLVPSETPKTDSARPGWQAEADRYWGS
ncbi:MAG: hypothetical protein JOZ93_01585 [Sinobacteraceae bacterium]|nr:hypothetical protein [Nevskiaceae bacterium]